MKKQGDPWHSLREVVKNYKKRGHATILLTIPRIEELLEAADHQTTEEYSTETCIPEGTYDINMKYRIVERKDIEKVLDVMKADYFEWTVTRNKLYYPENFNEEEALNACEEFNKGLTVTEGSRYFRIVSNRYGQLHCVGFIVKEGHKKFKEGDLLMAASFNAPARNFARGNIYDDSFKTTGHVRWTGIS
jgi:hypothetical protein